MAPWLLVTFRVNVELYQYGTDPLTAAGEHFMRKVRLSLSDGCHYDSIYPLQWLDSAAIVQCM